MRILRNTIALVLVLLCAGTSFAQVPNNYTTQQADLPCLNKRFSLVVHISDSITGPQPFDTVAFESMVEYANSLFEPICISFEACEYNSVENYRYLSHENNDAEEQVNTYGDPNRIDVFVTLLDSLDYICGSTTINGIVEEPNASIMVNKTCVDTDNSTLAHELGHYFGLYNTFETENGVELADSSNCATAGDLICDTPADPFIEGSNINWTSSDDPCRFVFNGTDPNGRFYTPHTANVMSEYSQLCTCGFTHDQLQRMAQNCIEGNQGVW